jgi:hypothetical protein
MNESFRQEKINSEKDIRIRLKRFIGFKNNRTIRY